MVFLLHDLVQGATFEIMAIQIGEAVGGDGVVLNHHRFLLTSRSRIMTYTGAETASRRCLPIETSTGRRSIAASLVPGMWPRSSIP